MNRNRVCMFHEAMRTCTMSRTLSMLWYILDLIFIPQQKSNIHVSSVDLSLLIPTCQQQRKHPKSPASKWILWISSTKLKRNVSSWPSRLFGKMGLHPVESFGCHSKRLPKLVKSKGLHLLHDSMVVKLVRKLTKVRKHSAWPKSVLLQTGSKSMLSMASLYMHPQLLSMYQ